MQRVLHIRFWLPLLLVAGLMGSLGIFMVARIPTARAGAVAVPAGA